MKNVYKQGDKVDIIAVARAARVSPSTVSRSFNHPHLVNPTTRKKIARAVERLGYIRNRAAQAMHGKRSATIGLIVPTINHTIFSEVIQSFSEAVDEAGFTILIASHGFDLDREYAVLRKLLEHRVDGIALIGLDHREASYRLIEQQGVPVIAIWNYDAGSRISCIGAENFAAGALAARHLVELGHRRIALVFPSTDENDRARDRRGGAEAALADYGITVPAHWRTEAPYSISQAKQAAGELLNHSTRPTALLCGNDVIAQGAIYAARQAGISVPSGLSVIGIGDFNGSAEMEPALTTVRIPARDIGRRAGEQITRAIAEAGALGIERQRCDVELLVRQTTAPACAGKSGRDG